MKKITAYALAAVPTLPLMQKKKLTSRIIIPINVDGSEVQVRFSNVCGKKPGVVDHAELAKCDANGRIAGGENSVRLTQSGQPILSVPAGREITCDPISMDVHAGEWIAVSVFCSRKPQTVGSVCYRVVNAAQAGPDLTKADFPYAQPNLKREEQMNQAFPFSIPYFKALDITVSEETAANCHGILLLGDSITAQARWAEPLMQELYTKHPGRLVMSNYGICGNQLSQDPSGPIMQMFGKAAVDRIAWDGATDYGVTDLLVALGINDLGLGKQKPEAYLSACRQLVDYAHAKGWNAYALAIYPGTPDPKRLEEVEAYRQECNSKLCEIYDGVIDTDAVLKAEGRIGYRDGYGYGDGVHLREEAGRLLAKPIAAFLEGKITSQ